MRKRILNCILAAFLAAAALCACGKDDLHYLETTTATIETAASETEAFSYIASDDGVFDYAFSLAGKSKRFQYQDGYLYFLAGLNTTGMANTERTVPFLVRMNMETGNVTAVCSDPVCAHDYDSGCLMYGVASGGFIAAPDGKVYIWKIYPNPGDEPGFYQSFAQYDPENNTLLELAEGIPDYLLEFYTEQYRIYRDAVYDEKTQKTYYRIMRTDLTTGKTVSIWEKAEETDEKMDDFMFLIGDRLYLNDYTCLYSINLDGEDRRVHVEGRIPISAKTDGTYVYYTDQRELCRRHLEGGEEERMGIFPYSYTLTEKYVYYRTGHEIVLGKARIRGYTGDTIVINGENICRYPLNGEGEEELIYTFEGETAAFRPDDWIVVGNYCYCTYTYWVDPDGDGIYRDGDERRSDSAGEDGRVFQFMRIDLTTGEAVTFAVDKYGKRVDPE